MNERFSSGRHTDPIPDTPEYYPSLEAQTEFFRHAFNEKIDEKQSVHSRQGPLYADAVDIMKQTGAMIEALNGSYTPGHLASRSYQSPVVQRELDSARFDVHERLKKIEDERLRLTRAWAENKIEPKLAKQTIESGVLDMPPFYRQAEGREVTRSQACVNATFRMIFGDITGWTPSEEVIENLLAAKYGSAIVEESIYSTIYQTKAFKEICDKRVLTIELIGADFATIARTSDKVKKGRPDAQVYCTLSLSSASQNNTIVHSSVLLGTNMSEYGYNQVVTHDPAVYGGGAEKREPTMLFARRWANAYNRALLTIALPSK